MSNLPCPRRAASVPGNRMRMTHRCAIAMVGPVSPTPRSHRQARMFRRAVHVVADRGDGRRGHRVTLFATGTSRTSADLHATIARGYGEDSSAWPWSSANCSTCPPL